MNADQLFISERIIIDPINPEKDASIISSWSIDLNFARSFRRKMLRPYASFEIKKYLEETQKETEDEKRSFIFSIRKKDDDSLLGILRIDNIEWNNQVAHLLIYFGNVQMEKTYLDDVLKLILNFMFNEMNLHYVYSFFIAKDLPRVMQLYEVNGFRNEAVMKEMYFDEGNYEDGIILGILRKDWEGKKIT